MEKYGFIYIWRDRKRKMYYIGCHWGTEDDGYICSSKRMRDVYRYRSQDFKRRIIQRNIPRNELLEEEHKWLSMIPKEELGKKYYNHSNHHFRHWSNNHDSDLSVKQKLSEKSKQLHQDPVFREKYLEGLKKRPAPTQETIEKRTSKIRGKPRDKETIEKIKQSWTPEKRKKASEMVSGENNYFYGKKFTGEQNGFFGKQHDPELKKKMNLKTSATMKGRKPSNIDQMKHMLWWNNGLINKRSFEQPGEGWTRGQIKKN